MKKTSRAESFFPLYVKPDSLYICGDKLKTFCFEHMNEVKDKYVNAMVAVVIMILSLVNLWMCLASILAHQDEGNVFPDDEDDT